VTSEKDVFEALEQIPALDGATTLAKSGAVAGVSIRDSKIYVSLAVDPAKVESAEPLRRRAEALLGSLPGVVGAVVALTAERPPAVASTPAPGPRAQAARQRVGVPGVERIVAVASGKGGVGKSTVAANLAVALDQSGWRVGLLDADIYGPSAPRLFGLREKPQSRDRRMLPLEAYGIRVMSIGLLVEEETAMIWRGPMVMSALNQLLRDVEWGELDCLLVDMPPGTGDAQLTMAQSAPLAGAVIVSTPQDLALIDARRGVAMFKKVDVPILGIVENMSYFACPHCGVHTDLFGHGGARQEADRQGVNFLGEAPLALAIREASDAGRPIVAAEPDGVYAAAFHAIAANVRAALADPAHALRPPPKIVLD
jgi:ATP-binding protein involved in chromosome partitioning